MQTSDARANGFYPASLHMQILSVIIIIVIVPILVIVETDLSIWLSRFAKYRGGFVSSGSRAIIGVTIMFLIISTVAVIGRFISRHMKRVLLGVDDWLMLGGLVRLVTLGADVLVISSNLKV
ncbi:hypothetical protein ACMFMG_003211 [Clarireedia jacksonii]